MCKEDCGEHGSRCMGKYVRATRDGEDAALQRGDIGRKAGESAVVISLFRSVGKAAQFVANQSFFGIFEVREKFGGGFPDLAIGRGRGGAIARA